MEFERGLKIMARAMKCDRCGELYEHHHIRYIGDQINGIRIINTNADCSYSWNIRTLDLCPKCCEELIKWLGDEKEEGKEDGGE